MSKSETANGHSRCLAKGIVAGLIGGLVGTVALTFAERMFPPRPHNESEEPSPDGALTAAAAASNHGIPWAFGATAGAVYGALAEYYPAATAREGAGFGMALEALTHESPLPALGLGSLGDDTVRERASELTSHVVYGLTTEWVRGLVRRAL